MILAKAIPLTFLSIGVFILMQVIMPVISYQIWLIGHSYNNQLLISPKQTKDAEVLGISIQTKDNFPQIISALSRENKANYRQFSLSIPKLKIKETRVEIDSNDLSGNLAHLPGSALPGEKGNVFISGHSALSQMFSLKEALFGNLTELKKGDEIKINANGAEFKYEVISLKVVDPQDISVINAPELQGRYVSLMTCVPPGLNFKRLVVLGKMI